MTGADAFGMRPTLHTLFAFAALTGFATDGEAGVTDPALRGRALYRDGIRSNGRPLLATTSETGLPLPAPFVACVNCHGHDARGKTEGGVSSSDIRWETLTKPYDLVRSDGRRRAPYDEARFFAAVTQGRDSSGHGLDPAMPRYQLSIEEAADVFAYLQQSARAADEGVTDETIRIGLRGLGDPASDASAMLDRRLLDAWCVDVNRRGIFRRQIEWVEIDSAILALSPAVLAVLEGDGAHAPAHGEEWKIPLLRVTAESDRQNNRYEFALYPSVVERVRALVRYAQDHNHAARPDVALIYEEGRTSRNLLDALVAELPSLQLRAAPTETKESDELVRTLRSDGVDNVVWLGEKNAFLGLRSSAARLAWNPLFLFPSSSGIQTTLNRTAYARDMLAKDLSPEALAIFHRCSDVTSTTDQDRLRQLRLLATTQLLRHALENADREVTREKLVDTLSALSEVRNGFAPPGGFSSRRHTAASGIYVVLHLTAGSQAQPQWVELD